MPAVKLAYEEYGEDSKQSLIIMHGFFASSRNWRLIAKKLSEYYHIYVVDLRNHGLSPHNSEMDYPTMAEDLKLLLDQHEIASANLLGHSMGGKVAMWFALQNPERVKNLIVADISPVTYQHNFNHTIQALIDLPLDQISNRKQADDFLSSAILEMSYRQFLLQNLQLTQGKYSWRVDLDVFYQTANNIVAFPDTELTFPDNENVLFIMGGNSNYLNAKAIDVYFPNAEITILEDANHWLHVDKPDDFCIKIINFLN